MNLVCKTYKIGIISINFVCKTYKIYRNNVNLVCKAYEYIKLVSISFVKHIKYIK